MVLWSGSRAVNVSDAVPAVPTVNDEPEEKTNTGDVSDATTGLTAIVTVNGWPVVTVVEPVPPPSTVPLPDAPS